MNNILLFYSKIWFFAGYPVNCLDGVELGVGPIVGEVDKYSLKTWAENFRIVDIEIDAWSPFLFISRLLI